MFRQLVYTSFLVYVFLWWSPRPTSFNFLSLDVSFFFHLFFTGGEENWNLFVQRKTSCLSRHPFVYNPKLGNRNTAWAREDASRLRIKRRFNPARLKLCELSPTFRASNSRSFNFTSARWRKWILNFSFTSKIAIRDFHSTTVYRARLARAIRRVGNSRAARMVH